MIIIDKETLTAYTAAVLEGMGLPKDAAKTEADSLIWANMRGIDSHGVQRIEMLSNLLQTGGMNTGFQMKIMSERAATVLIDADRAPGAVSATYAMGIAIEKAKKCGIGWALVTNTVTPYAVGQYVQIAVRCGMAGIASTFSSPLMAPYGSNKPGLHNGPISIGVPSYKKKPPLLDMATSTVAFGKIDVAIDKRIDIPADWALDGDGNPTTDPRSAAILLPFGIYKGSGLSFMFECLTGIMSGSPMVAPWLTSGDASIRKNTQNSIMAAIDISAFTDPDFFARQVDELIEAVKSLPKAEGFDEIYVPGEIEENMTVERIRDGIPLPPGTVEKLINAGNEYGVSVPEWLMKG